MTLEITSAERIGPLALRLAIEAAWVPEVAEAVGSGTSTNLAGLTDRLAECQAHGVLRTDIGADLLAEAFFALTSNLVMSRALLGAPPGYATDLLADQLTALCWSAATSHHSEGRTR